MSLVGRVGKKGVAELTGHGKVSSHVTSKRVIVGRPAFEVE